MVHRRGGQRREHPQPRAHSPASSPRPVPAWTRRGQVVLLTALATTAGAPATVHVIVTCANRKTAASPRALRLRDIHRRTDRRDAPAHGSAGSAARLARAAIAARDLYAGEHWTIARGLPGARRQCAGPAVGVLGGLRPDPRGRPDPPYAATFSARHRTRVPGGADGARIGGRPSLAGRAPPGQPRRSVDLVAADPRRLPAGAVRCLPAMPAETTSPPLPRSCQTRTAHASSPPAPGMPGRSPRLHGAGRCPAASTASAAPGRRSTSGSPPTCSQPGSSAAPTPPATWRELLADQPPVPAMSGSSSATTRSPSMIVRRLARVPGTLSQQDCCANSATPATPASSSVSPQLHRQSTEDRDMTGRATAPVLARRALRITQPKPMRRCTCSA